MRARIIIGLSLGTAAGCLWYWNALASGVLLVASIFIAFCYGFDDEESGGGTVHEY